MLGFTISQKQRFIAGEIVIRISWVSSNLSQEIVFGLNHDITPFPVQYSTDSDGTGRKEGNAHEKEGQGD